MKILIIAHGHPDLSPGGAEIAAYSLFIALRGKKDTSVTFLAWADQVDNNGTIKTYLNREDEFVFSCDRFDRFLFSQPSSKLIQNFKQFIININPHVIHFHHYMNLGLEFITAARETNHATTLVLTLHEYLAICHHHGLMVRTRSFELCTQSEPKQCTACFPEIRESEFAVRKQYIKAHFGRLDILIAPSAFLHRRYVEWGIDACKLVILPNGVAAARPIPPRPLLANERRAVFGFFGQIHPFKGVLELLAAFAELRKVPTTAARSARLLIHGAYLELNHEDYISRFNEQIRVAGTRVRFRGPYQHADLERLMMAVDWVIVPSIWWENSPLVIEEALMNRRPVICSDIGGMAEKVRPGLDGYHFESGSPMALASLILRLVEEKGIWDRLQSTMREPTNVMDSAEEHLKIYRANNAVGKIAARSVIQTRSVIQN